MEDPVPLTLDDLPPDTLLLVFSNFTLAFRWRVLRCVCKALRYAVTDHTIVDMMQLMPVDNGIVVHGKTPLVPIKSVPVGAEETLERLRAYLYLSIIEAQSGNIGLNDLFYGTFHIPMRVAKMLPRKRVNPKRYDIELGDAFEGVVSYHHTRGGLRSRVRHLSTRGRRFKTHNVRRQFTHNKVLNSSVSLVWSMVRALGFRLSKAGSILLPEGTVAPNEVYTESFEAPRHLHDCCMRMCVAGQLIPAMAMAVLCIVNRAYLGGQSLRGVILGPLPLWTYELQPNSRTILARILTGAKTFFRDGIPGAQLLARKTFAGQGHADSALFALFLGMEGLSLEGVFTRIPQSIQFRELGYSVAATWML
jgi:hypothetical protein